MKIIQVLDMYAKGNAITDCAITYQKFARRMNIECHIVARIKADPDKDVKDMSFLKKISSDDLIMYHMCIGTPLNREIILYDCKKVMIYHNITPAFYFENYDSHIAQNCEHGLRDLVEINGNFLCCLADSEYNRQDMIRCGYDADKIDVIPPLVSGDFLEQECDQGILQKYDDGFTNLLFVGRVVPHKKQEDLIRIFAYYKTNFNPKSRLILAGGLLDSYYACLQKYVDNLGIEDVILTGQISDEELRAYYRTADFFVSTSEHEGYGIPLIEAMMSGIPVIAYDAAAVRETLGGAGVLVDDKDPVFVSKLIDTIANSAELKNKIVKEQFRRIECLTEEQLFIKFSEWMDSLKNISENTQSAVETGVVITPDCNPYDVILTIKASDWNVAKINLRYIRENLKPKRIVVISSKEIRNYLNSKDNVVFVDEDCLYDGMSLKKVKDYFYQRRIENASAGWFLQQFLKLAYAYVCEDEYYLTWDADTIPLQSIQMLDEESGKPYFDMKPEYVEPYFRTLDNLLGLEKIDNESFIAEHMLFKKDIVIQFIEQINCKKWIKGGTFWEKILNVTDYSNRVNAFSEFESYGTYVQYYFPGTYLKRRLHTVRTGRKYLGEYPSEDILQWVAKDKAIISFEQSQSIIPNSVLLAQNESFRQKHSFDDLVRHIHMQDVLTRREWLAQEEKELQLDYPWAKEPQYMKSTDCALKDKKRKANATTNMLFVSPNRETAVLAVQLAFEGYIVDVYDGERMISIVERNICPGIKAKSGSGDIRYIDDYDKQKKYAYIVYSDDTVDIQSVFAQDTVICINGVFEEEKCNQLLQQYPQSVLFNASLIDDRSLLTFEKTDVYAYTNHDGAISKFRKMLESHFTVKRIDALSEFAMISQDAFAFRESWDKLKRSLKKQG